MSKHLLPLIHHAEFEGIRASFMGLLTFTHGLFSARSSRQLIYVTHGGRSAVRQACAGGYKSFFSRGDHNHVRICNLGPHAGKEGSKLPNHLDDLSSIHRLR